MNKEYDTLTYRIFCQTLNKLTTNDDNTAERCYVSSNEYLSRYMKNMDLKDKKIATVGSSGDQFFVALLQNCQDITIIDANPYTKVFVEYKMALFKNFDFESMKKVITSTQLFHWSTYSKLSHSLSNTAKMFWDTLFLEQEDKVNDYFEQFDQAMLARQLVHPEAIFVNDFYTDKERFSRLQHLLQQDNYTLKFLTADLHDFPKALKEKYDLIMLSNIFAYHSAFDLKTKFEKTVEKLYKKNLKPNGSIQVHYSYRQHWHSIDCEELAGHKLRIQEIDNNNTPKTIYYIDKNEEEREIE